MSGVTRRVMQLGVVAVALAGLSLSVNAVPGAATPANQFISEVLGRGTLSQGNLAVKKGSQVVVVRATVDPGGSSGWHSHPGGGIIIIQQGEITTYRSRGESDEQEGSSSHETGQFPRCLINTYTQGQSFIERPGEALMAVNTGSIQTIIYATFPGVPVGGSPRTDRLNPGTCPV